MIELIAYALFAGAGFAAGHVWARRKGEAAVAGKEILVDYYKGQLKNARLELDLARQQLRGITEQRRAAGRKGVQITNQKRWGTRVAKDAA